MGFWALALAMFRLFVNFDFTFLQVSTLIRSLPKMEKLLSTLPSNLINLFSLQKMIWKYFYYFNLICYCEYGFHKENSTVDHFFLLPAYWSTAFMHFGECFAVSLNISKSFERVWHKLSTLKLLFFSYIWFFLKPYLGFHFRSLIEVV